jgi:hypothetical protein
MEMPVARILSPTLPTVESKPHPREIATYREQPAGFPWDNNFAKALTAAKKRQKSTFK